MSHGITRAGLVLSVALTQILIGCAEDRAHVTPPISTLAKKADSITLTREKRTTSSEGPIQCVSSLDKVDPQLPPGPQALENSGQTPAKAETELDIFHGEKTLSPSRLIRAVIERNPTLDQMRAAASAAQARFPQVISLDDPILGMTTGPGSAWSNNANFAARAEITQKIPYSGKRELRGQVVQAEAGAALKDVDDIRLQLTETASIAFADYFLVEKALIVNSDNLKILDDFKKNAVARVKNGQAPQQDILQADVEIARQRERSIALERARQVAKARLNTLMHLQPDSPLPGPENVAPVTALPEAADLRARAISARPDLKALANRIASEEASVALAVREYKPDVELLAAYDSFWQGDNGRPMQWQIGARINLPVRLSRRGGAVTEAQARFAQRRAELSRLTDQVGLQVQEAYELLRESEKAIELYDKQLLPAAEANLKEARTAYVNNKIIFVTLIEAQRSLIGLKDRYYETLADAVRRRAALERAVGEAIETPNK